MIPDPPAGPPTRHPHRPPLGWLLRRGWLRPVNLRAWVRWRLARWRWPDVEFEGFVFIGRGVRLEVARGVGRLRIGAWTHLNDRVKIRAHQGTVVVGPKCVLGYDLTVNAHLDVRIGEATIIGDRVYVCDFDHDTTDPHRRIKDQGLVRSPVRIGADCWLGTGVTVVRGTDLGDGSVVAAHAVVRGAYPPRSVVAGVPGRVVADRDRRWAEGAEGRAYVDALGEQAAERVRRLVAGEDVGP
ncbi:acyltransferase [Auraticoccus monumenti]|uniref:Acetyltransferase (Isoleucine patch superfamily) n=1 Tax=Auraticoccus monumenti TaxID=675864 RepID=A0A1G7B1G7_9ACTN|nr:acyltransferase [Auraticoccus monumenti]SDE20968.1 Acetyltransferase (isoleucine patch superfamily) [Auraticoccus monumenti]